MSINPAGFAQQANMPSQLCQAKWAQLSLQLSPFNAVVAIDEHTFMLWNHVDQQFVLQSYMGATGGTIPVFVRDGSAPRIFLGPLAMFQGQPMMQSPFQLPTALQGPQAIMGAMPVPAHAPRAQAQAHISAAGVAIPQARSSTQQAGGKKIPRPSNAWIMYRKHFHAAFAQANHGISNVQLSRLISNRWHDEPQAVRDYWHKKADEAKAEHKLKYPDYQYKPRKSSEKKRRMTKKKAAALVATTQVVEITPAAEITQFAPTTQAVPTTTVSAEPSGQSSVVDNNATVNPVDLFADAKLFAQGMFDQGYDMFHGSASYYAQNLFNFEDNTPVENDGTEFDGAEYDGAEYGGNDTLDILFPRN